MKKSEISVNAENYPKLYAMLHAIADTVRSTHQFYLVSYPGDRKLTALALTALEHTAASLTEERRALLISGEGLPNMTRRELRLANFLERFASRFGI